MTAYDTTPKGVRYKFVDSANGEVLLVDGYAYSVGEGCRYNIREFEVAGFEIGGTVDECEVSEGEDETLFSGTELECWHYVIERLGSPNSTWAGFAGDYYTDDGEFYDEDECEDEDGLAD